MSQTSKVVLVKNQIRAIFPQLQLGLNFATLGTNTGDLYQTLKTLFWDILGCLRKGVCQFIESALDLLTHPHPATHIPHQMLKMLITHLIIIYDLRMNVQFWKSSISLENVISMCFSAIISYQELKICKIGIFPGHIFEIGNLNKGVQRKVCYKIFSFWGQLDECSKRRQIKL